MIASTRANGHAASSAQRRGAVIVFIDMVGYSALAARNEVLCLHLLDELRRGIMPVFLHYGGRLVKTIGDGFLLEFADACEALSCMLDVQQRVARRNAQVRPELRLWLRIGIHEGTVIVVPNGDVYGDTVNTAARVEPIAEPGEVCLTEDVYASLPPDYPARFILLGKAKLKNMGSRRIYSAAPFSSDTRARRRRIRFYWRQLKHRRALIAVLAALLSLGIAAPVSFFAFPNAQTLDDIPFDAYEEFYSGERAFNALQLPEAEAHYERAVKLAPLFAIGWERLAHVQRWNNHPRWHASLSRALELQSALPSRELELAHAMGAMVHGDDAQQEHHLKSALALAPDDAIVQFDYGDFLFHHGQYEAARVQFEKVLASNPTHHGAYDHSIWALLALGRMEDALEVATEWSFRDPSPGSVAAHGDVLIAMGRYDEALAFYDWAASMPIAEMQSLAHKPAVARYYRDGLDAALATPGLGEHHELRGTLLIHAGQTEAGLDVLRAWTRDQSDPWFWTQRYEVLRAFYLAWRGGRHDEAGEVMRSWVLHQPLPGNFGLLAALTCIEIDDMACLKTLRHQQIPSEYQTLIDGWLAAEGGDLDLGLAELNEAERRTHPRDRLALWYLQATLLERAGDHQAAQSRLSACADETQPFYAVFTGVQPRCAAARW